MNLLIFPVSGRVPNGEPAWAGFDSSSKGKDKTVTGYDVKGIS
jgi:hypothetical protein